MLRSLRIKFVVIIMALVGTVLISVLVGSLVSAWQTQHDTTMEALEHSLYGSVFDLPRFGPRATDPEKVGEDGGAGRVNMLVLCVDLDANGVVLAKNDAPVDMDADVLSTVVSDALDSDVDAGWDSSLHIAWMRTQRSTGAWRVVLADTSAGDLLFERLVIRYAAITVIAMGALLIIALGLSSWVLKPVETAWEQQRRFVADASHELKTPLAVIMANTQILQHDDSLGPETRRWVDSTAEESAHMRSLVEELLELARTDEGSLVGKNGVMRQDDVDFSSVVENATLEFDAIAFERGCAIEADLAEGIHVTGDSEWLTRLAKILVDNACKYAHPGTSIHATLRREGRSCVLSVNNLGDVIEQEDLGHIFDRFYRTDKARSRESKAGGFGLGLAIAKGIATSHGGTITATSDEAQGTTFTVTLPATHA